MQFEYKCPICKAKNILTANQKICRRCKEDLSIVYEIKFDKINKVFLELIRN
jgi:hypothetical protein